MKPKPGVEELRAARRKHRGYFWFVGIFSFFVNLLMLTGPLYMLQVYDRVLSSRSEATLLALTAIVIFLYLMMGVFDFARGRIMGRVGARFQADLDDRVFRASMKAAARKTHGSAVSGTSHLEAIQRLYTSPVFVAFFDLPWTPVFLFGITLFHPWLGILAVVGGSILIGIALLARWLLERPSEGTARYSAASENLASSLRNEAEMIQSMGMVDAAMRKWKVFRTEALAGQLGQADLSGGFTNLTKSIRLLLQSLMLGLGAYLVLQDELTPGAMIAGSILLARALAPIEVMVSQWPVAQRSRQGWKALSDLLAEIPPEIQRTPLPPAEGTTQRAADHRRAAGPATGRVAHGQFQHRARAGGGGHRTLRSRKDNPCAGPDGALATGGRAHPARWRDLGSIRSRNPWQLHRLPAPEGGAL